MQTIKGVECDEIVLTETWLREGADAPELAGFTTSLNLPRARWLQGSSPTRGGIAVHVADALASSVTVLATRLLGAYALLRLDGCIGQGEDAYMFACYMPPERIPALAGKGAAVWAVLREEVKGTLLLGHVCHWGLECSYCHFPGLPGYHQPPHVTSATPSRYYVHLPIRLLPIRPPANPALLYPTGFGHTLSSGSNTGIFRYHQQDTESKHPLYTPSVSPSRPQVPDQHSLSGAAVDSLETWGEGDKGVERWKSEALT